MISVGFGCVTTEEVIEHISGGRLKTYFSDRLPCCPIPKSWIGIDDVEMERLLVDNGRRYEYS